MGQSKNILTYELQSQVTELRLALALVHTGNDTFTAADLVEWITPIISPEWIFPKRSVTTNMTLILDCYGPEILVFLSSLLES